MEKDQEILALAAQAGEILLKNGAEISRVQETVEHILTACGIQNKHVYVVSNGLFLSVNESGARPLQALRNVSDRNVYLARIEAVNAVSREIAEKGLSCDITEMHGKLAACATLAPAPAWAMPFACATGCACFCFLMGGRLADSLNAFIAGAVLQLFLFLTMRLKTNKYIECILAAAVVTMLCYVLHFTGLGDAPGKSIIGAIMPLVPGVLFITAIRDFFNSDHLSGTIKIFDALMIAASIAVGVGATLFVWSLTPLGGLI